MFDNIPKKPLNLTQEQQEKFFEVGDRIYLRDDALKYSPYLQWDDQENDILQGETGVISRIEYVDENFVNTGEGDDFNYEIGDMLIDIDFDEELLNIDEMYWFYKSVHSEKLDHFIGPTQPTYEPRKLIREANVYKDIPSMKNCEYDVVFVRREDEADHRKFIKILQKYRIFSSIGYHGSDKIMWICLHSVHNLEQFGVYNSNSNYIDSGQYKRDNPSNVRWYPNILNTTNLEDNLDRILGIKVDASKMYEPRKIIRESINKDKIKERLNEIPYDVLLAKVNNQQEYTNILRFLTKDNPFSYYTNNYDPNQYEPESPYLWVVLKQDRSQILGTMVIYFESDRYMLSGQYLRDYGRDYRFSEIMTLVELKRILDNVLSDHNPVRMYAPRTLVRESNIYDIDKNKNIMKNYDYNIILVKTRGSVDEINKLNKILSKYGVFDQVEYSYSQPVKWLCMNNSGDGGEAGLTYQSDSNFIDSGDYIIDHDRTTFCPDILDMSNVEEYLDRIFKYIPNASAMYAPRTLVRESNNTTPPYPPTPPTLSTEEQQELFKAGEKVFIRKDADSYTIDFNDDMEDCVGKWGTIQVVLKLIDVYGDDDDRYPSSLYNLYDLCLSIKVDDQRRNWYWYYKSIFTPKSIPNASAMYAPRKIIREFSQFINEADVYDMYRFKTEEEFINEYGSDWADIVDWWDDMNDLFGTDYDKPVDEDEMVDDEIIQVGGLEHADDFFPIYNWMLTKRIPKASSIPNYEPRNIIRESKEKIRYRFKTEEEFEKEYGRNWKSVVTWANSDGMDFLFGKPFNSEVNENEMRSDILSVVGYIADIVNNNRRWTVFNKMLKQIEKPRPSYEPRRLVRD